MKSNASFVLGFVLALFGVDRSATAGVIIDLEGDAVGIDITSLEVSFGSLTVDVNLTFSALTPILPASANAINSVSGFIEFDLDLNPSTGFNPGLVDLFGGLIGNAPTGLGVDGVILLGSEFDHPGTVDITFFSGLTGTGSVSTTSTSMNISCSRSLFGASSELQFAAVVGDQNFATDATGVGVANVSAVPEPSSWVMMSLAGALLLRYRPNRRV